MSDKPKYVATLKIEKITPTTRPIGFSDSPSETREEVISVKVSRGDLNSTKSVLCDHLDIVEEL